MDYGFLEGDASVRGYHNGSDGSFVRFNPLSARELFDPRLKLYLTGLLIVVDEAALCEVFRQF